MERLLLALDDEEDENGIDVYVMPLGDEARDVMQIITMLRANGFTCDMDYAGRGA